MVTDQNAEINLNYIGYSSCLRTFLNSYLKRNYAWEQPSLSGSAFNPSLSLCSLNLFLVSFVHFVAISSLSLNRKSTSENRNLTLTHSHKRLHIL